MTDFTAYEPATGRILWTGTCGSDVFSFMRTAGGLDYKVIAGHHDDRVWYVKDGQPRRRPTVGILRTTIPLAALSVVANAPAGTTVYMDDILQGQMDDDTLEMEPTEPGVTHIRLVPPFPYAEASFTVTVT